MKIRLRIEEFIIEVKRLYLASDIQKRIRKTVAARVRDGLMVDSWPETGQISSDVAALAANLTAHVEELLVNMDQAAT